MSDEFNKVEYSIPYKLIEWERPTRLPLVGIPLFHSHSSTVFTPDTYTQTQYRLQFQPTLIPQSVHSEGGNEIVERQEKRGMRYLKKLIQLNSNAPKSQQSPTLSLFKMIHNLGNGGDVGFIKAIRLTAAIPRLGNPQLPLYKAIIAAFLPTPIICPFTSLFLFQSFSGPFDIHPIRSTIYTRQEVGNILLQILGAHGSSTCGGNGDNDDQLGTQHQTIQHQPSTSLTTTTTTTTTNSSITTITDDMYYHFPTPISSSTSKVQTLDLSTAHLCDPRVEFNNNNGKTSTSKSGQSSDDDADTPLSYYYNTPNMSSNIGQVLFKFHSWVKSRQDVVEYLEQREDYIRTCFETGQNPIISFLTLPYNQPLGGQNPLEIDWHTLCSPAESPILGAVDEDDGDDDEDDETGTKQQAKQQSAKQQSAKQQQSTSTIHSNPNHHPFLTLTKSTPSWWAWSFDQFISTSHISTLNEPDMTHPTANINGQSFGTSPLRQLATNQLQQFQDQSPSSSSSSSDNVIDFTHNQFSIINALFYTIVDMVSFQHEALTATDFTPEMDKLSEERYRCYGAMTRTSEGKHLPLTAPYFPFRGSSSFSYPTLPHNYHPFIYLTQHIHNIPQEVNVPQQPRDWLLPPLQSPTMKSQSTPINLALQQSYVTHARHISYYMVNCLITHQQTRHADAQLALWDLLGFQTGGVLQPSSTTLSFILYDGPSTNTLVHQGLQTLWTVSVMRLYSEQQANLFAALKPLWAHISNRVYKEFVQYQQDLANSGDGNGSSVVSSRGDNNGNGNDGVGLWGMMGIALGIVGVAVGVGGAAAWWLKKQRTERRNRRRAVVAADVVTNEQDQNTD